MSGRILITLILILFVPSSLSAQQQAANGLLFQSATKAPYGLLQPGGWMVLRANLSNTSDHPLTATILATVAGAPDMQSARTITVLPKHDEAVDIFVQIPASLDTADYAEFELTLYAMQDGREVMMDSGGQPMRQSFRYPVVRKPNAAFIALEDSPPSQPYWHWPDAEPYSSYEWVAATRVASGNSRSTVSVNTRSLPLSLPIWEEVGLVVISEPSLLQNAATVESLKQFVNNGGRVWVMVDLVPCELVRPLLGNGQSCVELDDVELNEFTVELTEKTMELTVEDRSVSTDKPARMKRVVQSGGRVSHTVNGWPAAIWMDAGYGEILLTTLISDGWMEPGTQSEDPQNYTNFKTRAWAMSLSVGAHDTRRALPITESIDYPLQFIGNPVLSRGLVAAILLGFVGLLAALAGLQSRFGEISRFAAYAPLVSCITGLVLFAASTWIRRDIPETLSKLQLVQVTEDGTAALIREQGAVHVDSERSMRLVGDVDGAAIADATVQSGIKRYTLADFQSWSLSNKTWPLGTWRYRAEYALPTQGLVATAELDENGLRLNLPGSLESPFEDPIVNFVPGTPMIGEGTADGILADGSLLAQGDRWIQGTLISDEQRRRLEVYQSFFQPNDRVPTPPHTVLGWTRPWEGVHWEQESEAVAGLKQAGSALVCLPIHLQRPRVGQQLRLPAGLLRLQRDMRQISRTSVYSDVTGSWASEIALAINSELQFSLPSEVLPFQADSILFELDIKAPYRTVRLLSRAGNGPPTEIVTLDGPSLPWRGEVTEPTILEDARDGTIDVLLQISDRQDLTEGGSSATVVTWTIDSFRASLRGSRTAE